MVSIQEKTKLELFIWKRKQAEGALFKRKKSPVAWRR